MKFYFILFGLIVLSCSKNKSLVIKHNKANTFYDKAFEYRESKQLDSAFFYFDKARDLFLQRQDSLGAGKCLNNMAIIQEQFGDNYGSQETSLEAIKYLNESNPANFEYVKSNYNNLGITSYNLKESDNAIRFYNLAIKFSPSTDEKETFINNKGNAYRQKKDYKNALQMYASILKDSPQSKKLLAMVITNQARTKWLQNKDYDPIQEFNKGLDIRIKEHDLYGQVSSHSHLADTYQEIDPQKALFHANKMYKLAKEIKNPNDEIEALQKLILLESPEKSKLFFKIYQKRNDSIDVARKKAKNQFALIRYETEKNKAENLLLQKGIAQKEYQITKQNILIGGISLGTLILIISASFWYKRRKQTMLLESDNKLKEQQLKVSKKVHDVVANGIYQVMTKIENQENFDKEKALDELEFVYEKSRDISYEKPETKAIVEFDEKISSLIGSFKNGDVNTFLAGNEKNIWSGINESVKDNIYQIIRELLVNMKKHSRASLVAFKFERNNNMVKIQYTDNGIGVPGNFSYKNGLRNTVSRIETIAGEIIFDNTIEKGFRIYISFPTS
ncbi:tetratricopeptide repeat-containing sensor histidine kinase [Chryseobacterium culicis]|uniref:tetratricopeptide repeat-containing sensor histidine kinase n=1 Tax=Chryseobacterium culicis TaxID=680127 RepID=UPI0018734123|nr:ATP-binding protein [Chryseobacterium culicis]MBE4950614.1 ATP-binding protein [Chryseobacterium culicis]